MSRNLTLLVALAAVTPLAIEIPVDRSASVPPGPSTRVNLSGGIAYYEFISRGCEGQIIDRLPAHGQDATLSIEQDIDHTPIRLGVRGGWVRDRIDSTTSTRFEGVPVGADLTNRYVNPHIGYESPSFGVGMGRVFHERGFITAGEGARGQTSHTDNDFSAHVRIGREEKRYFAIRWMETEPLESAGGYLTLGMGGKPSTWPADLYGGIAAGGPYEGAGAFLQSRWRVRRDLTLDVKARGGSGGYGVALGLGLRMPSRPRLEP